MKQRRIKHDVVAMGEPLVQFSPLEPGPVSHADLFDKHLAGSESNVLIGLSRLGYRTALISRVGSDEMSRFVLRTLRGEGVDVRWVAVEKGMKCGVYITQRSYPVPGKNDVIYYRSGSAASTISAEDVPETAIRGGGVFHLSGITPALSPSCKKASFEAIRLARKFGVTVSFDPNYRRKLWDEESAKVVFRSMARLSDLLFLDSVEAGMILGKKTDAGKPEATLRALTRLGPKTVVLKIGVEGGIAALKDGEYFHVPSFKVPTVDVIGAGDAVVSGFLGGLLGGKDVPTSLAWGAASSALVVMRRGDYENLPTSSDLAGFLASMRAGREVDPR